MYSESLKNNLNEDISKHFTHLKTIEKDYKITHEGVSRMVMLDRYAQKDKNLITLKRGDLVISIIREDAIFPTRGIGYVVEELENQVYAIKIEDEYLGSIDPELIKISGKAGIIHKQKYELEKPLELFYEQIAYRVSKSLTTKESPKLRSVYLSEFYEQLKSLNIVPAGRVLYGADSDSDVTFFNCFVMPFIHDSRSGIAAHRQEVMEIMSHGGGVGSNGSTLRPKGTVAKTVGGKSSGAVSWLNDLSTLTHLVEQGGSRRGAQMIMLADWHPDIIEFIISKMQNAKILLWLKENSKSSLIRDEASKKLKFEVLSDQDRNIFESILNNEQLFNEEIIENAKNKLALGGSWEVIKSDFLTGTNISVTISDEFMNAVATNGKWNLRFPDLDNYTVTQKQAYDEHWNKIGNVHDWEKMGYPIKTYYTINASDLWDLINFCATYSAEPGIFFIDRANEMTNAQAYGMRVVATNPCGEQPLAPYSVCNLSAINLANFVNKKTSEILYDELSKSITTCVRMQDNVIDSTPYFLEANKKQALGERRIGLGVMGLHDLLIWSNLKYGSKEANEVIDKIFETITTSAYRASINIAKEKGSFPFLKSREAFINSGFMKTMPEDIRNDILKYGIRNSHLLTVAPTGSTGTMVGVSTGLEPYFAFSYFRSGRLGKFMEVKAKIVNDWLQYHPEFKEKPLPDIFVSAMQLTPEDHANVQCIIQRWVDSSISKTVNAPKGYTVKKVEQIYYKLYKDGAKGGTVYVDGSRDSQVLSLSDDDNQMQEQVNLSDLGLTETFADSINETKPIKPGWRNDRQDRKIGTDLGDLCTMCKEGVLVFSVGCYTCNNCGIQSKCGL
ncbi:vitamin B12-dependent ribonucleotide reductase [Spiroplasma endosymbiont of Phycita roborella]|uniref:vitamin B12-dependent ribonucleotide reductase n=1 Tax=Spiroplasma endosymbiont of Phycita roborella TaxID=3066311 RepID=UPI00313CF116